MIGWRASSTFSSLQKTSTDGKEIYFASQTIYSCETKYFLHALSLSLPHVPVILLSSGGCHMAKIQWQRNTSAITDQLIESNPKWQSMLCAHCTWLNSSFGFLVFRRFCVCITAIWIYMYARAFVTVCINNNERESRRIDNIRQQQNVFAMRLLPIWAK